MKKKLAKTLHKIARAPAPPAPPNLAAPIVTRKLDLGCGQSPHEGFEGVDIWSGAKHVVDLFKFPWPFDSDSIDEIYCSHFLEHIPMVEVDGQDMLCRFMDECYRILKPNGWMTAIVPSGRSNRAFQDPTHRRFFVEATFGYFVALWRISTKLDHYNIKCDFEVNVQTTVDSVLNTKHAAVAQRELQNYWNTSIDFHARMQAIKPARTELVAVSPSK